MNEITQERMQPVVHTGEELRVTNLVNRVRALAANILVEAQLAGRTINHATIGTPEQRHATTTRAALEIIEIARGLYPNQQVLNPPANLTFRTTI